MATYYIGAQAFGINSLAHAAPGQKGWKKPNAKYIERYIGKNGKWQYVYDEPGNGAARAIGANVRANRRAESAEADRYNTSKYYGKRTVYSGISRPVPHNTNPTVFYGDDDEARAARVSSNTKRNMSNPDNAKRSRELNRKVAFDNGVHELRDVTNETFDTIKREGARAISNGKNWLEKLFNSITGGDARRRMEQARRDGDPAAFQQARAEYERSLAGRVSSLATRAWSTVKSTASKAIERGKDFIAGIVHDVSDYIRSEDARRRMTNGKTAMERLKAREDYYNTDTGDAKRRAEQGATAMERLQGRQDYNRTIAGRIDNAKAAVERAGAWLTGSAKKAAETAVEGIVNAGGSVLGIFNGPQGPMAVVQQNGETVTMPIYDNADQANRRNVNNGGPNAIRS